MPINFRLNGSDRQSFGKKKMKKKKCSFTLVYYHHQERKLVLAKKQIFRTPAFSTFSEPKNGNNFLMLSRSLFFHFLIT